MKLSIRAILTNIAVLILFVLVAVAYCYPVIKDRAIFQSDIAQYKGMAKERDDYKRITGIESYWTNSAFGGMPTYQLGANYPHDYIKKLDKVVRFLPRPADYLFLYFLGFYILMSCMKVDWRLAILGSLAFGFSTYLIIILGVGHNAKAHALGYLPMVLGGILLAFRKQYVLGFIVTALAMALEINANHYQMTYYFLLLVLLLGLVYLIDAIRKQQIAPFFKAVGVLVVAVLLAVGTNYTGIAATKEYADWSTRGPSELTIEANGEPKKVATGLDKSYITEYSFGISESMVLLIPRFFGGSGAENLGKDSKVYDYLTQQGLPRSKALEFTERLPLYWGAQPIVAGPAYIGIVVFFFFVIGVIAVKGKTKWWLLSGAIMALLLSWGKNFPLLTNLMIDYFPLYNKFRAVSSIQVILELCIPILGILGLKELLFGALDNKKKMNILKIAGGTVLGILLAVFLFKGMFGFEGLNDARYRQYFGNEIMGLIQRDREAVYTSDSLRALLYVVLAALVLFLGIRGVAKRNLVLICLGLLVVSDLVGVGLRYVNSDDFVRRSAVSQPFKASEIDRQLQNDQSVYRVFDPDEGLNGARNSYFHKSLGGYHAAKPARLQELFEFHLYNNNLQVLNMLNVKYIFQEDETGNRVPAVNPDANGPAWFVENLIPVTNANAEIKALDTLDTKRSAVFNSKTNPSLSQGAFVLDSLSKIEVIDHRPDYIHYQVNTTNPAFLVLSEMHYPHGWIARLDSKEVPHYRVNYALRGLTIPAGKHKVVFKFDPEVVRRGSTITLISNIVLILIMIAGGIWLYLGSGTKQKEV
ncbi:MAG: YfhO family protein [Bacteroidota bacterium]